ncbi:DUF6705 family protein [Chryseobacterium viscerum]|uniref:DUF6705 domain-containing protein n=1 Tax=Chryseobacterium viscerum TaxID=1037377 RepID=A0A5N4BN14_9FLAO|nr:DUF6705 family protein [Chryseobacterium viscerum]KAB1229800.1 hypothetical protein F8D52_16135 [Chryseobacterium viscerum]
MKNIFLIILLNISVSCMAQIYPLRTFTDIPENAYEKDTNNEFKDYVGIWKGTWNNKTIFLTFKKITNQYDNVFKYYRDYLIVKFKVIDNNGNILFDNTNLADDKAKIYGGGFKKIHDKYSLIYSDPDLCHTSGTININFMDSSKTKLDWKYFYRNEVVTVDCPYYNTEIPQPLPKEIVLTKQ